MDFSDTDEGIQSALNAIYTIKQLPDRKLFLYGIEYTAEQSNNMKKRVQLNLTQRSKSNNTLRNRKKERNCNDVIKTCFGLSKNGSYSVDCLPGN